MSSIVILWQTHLPQKWWHNIWMSMPFQTPSSGQSSSFPLVFRQFWTPLGGFCENNLQQVPPHPQNQKVEDSLGEEPCLQLCSAKNIFWTKVSFQLKCLPTKIFDNTPVSLQIVSWCKYAIWLILLCHEYNVQSLWMHLDRSMGKYLTFEK